MLKKGNPNKHGLQAKSQALNILKRLAWVNTGPVKSGVPESKLLQSFLPTCWGMALGTTS